MRWLAAMRPVFSSKSLAAQRSRRGPPAGDRGARDLRAREEAEPRRIREFPSCRPPGERACFTDTRGGARKCRSGAPAAPTAVTGWGRGATKPSGSAGLLESAGGFGLALTEHAARCLDEIYRAGPQPRNRIARATLVDHDGLKGIIGQDSYRRISDAAVRLGLKKVARLFSDLRPVKAGPAGYD